MVPEHKPTWGPGTASAASVGHFLASAQHVLQHPPTPGLLGSNPSGSPRHSRHHFGLFHCLLCPTRQYTQLVGLCSAWASSCLSPLTTESGELPHDEVSHLLPRCRFPPEAKSAPRAAHTSSPSFWLHLATLSVLVNLLSKRCFHSFSNSAFSRPFCPLFSWLLISSLL